MFIKKQVALFKEPPVFCYRKLLSCYSDIYSLFTFLSFAYFEFYFLVFFQSAETFLCDTCVMNENIVPFFGCDKAVTFGGIKPFNCAFHKK